PRSLEPRRSHPFVKEVPVSCPRQAVVGGQILQGIMDVLLQPDKQSPDQDNAHHKRSYNVVVVVYFAFGMALGSQNKLIGQDPESLCNLKQLVMPFQGRFRLVGENRLL